MSVNISFFVFRPEQLNESLHTKPLNQLAEEILSYEEHDCTSVFMDTLDEETDRQTLIDVIRCYTKEILCDEFATMEKIPKSDWEDISTIHRQQGENNNLDNLHIANTKKRKHHPEIFQMIKWYTFLFLLLPFLTFIIIPIDVYLLLDIILILAFFIFCLALILFPAVILIKVRIAKIDTTVSEERPSTVTPLQLYDAIIAIVLSQMHGTELPLDGAVSKDFDFINGLKIGFHDQCKIYLVGVDQLKKDRKMRAQDQKNESLLDKYQFAWEGKMKGLYFFDFHGAVIDFVPQGGNILDQMNIHFYDRTCTEEIALIESCSLERKREIYSEVLQDMSAQDNYTKVDAERYAKNVVEWITGMQDLLKYAKDNNAHIIACQW